jgi:hypothetical protein
VVLEFCLDGRPIARMIDCRRQSMTNLAAGTSRWAAASKDYEFDRASMEKRWQQGTTDARTVLHASPWLAPMPKELGVRVFDVPPVSPCAEA